MEIDFKIITEQYIQNKQQLFEKLAQAASNIDIKTFKRISFEDFHINTEGSSFSIKNVLYFFKIMNDSDKMAECIRCQVQKIKDDKQIGLKLPLVNKEFNNSILYVGKSSGIFSNRLKQHLKINPKQTYALHLEYWKSDEILKDVKLELYFLNLDLVKYQLTTEQERVFLEEIETVLHSYLKPILGRTGH